jgi:signal transduction histidine kinase/ActR/RegA family two-component response regulator
MAATRSALIVDDSARWTELLSRWLRDQGYTVRVASDGLAAIEALRAAPPEILVTDYFLPNLDGAKLCHLARRIAQESTVTTVILSGAADERLTPSQRAQADAVIAKSEPETVFEKLRRVLDGRVETADGCRDLPLAPKARSLAAKLYGLKQYLDALHEGIGDAVLQVDASLRVLRMNSTAADLFQIVEEETLARPVTEALRLTSDHPLIECMQRAVDRGMRTLHPMTIEVGAITMRVNVAALIDPGGQATALVIAQDVTDLRKAEEARAALHARLHETDKMASLGHLVAGVCHEINNPLAAIMLNLDSLSALVDQVAVALGDDAPVVEELREVLTETGDASARVHAVVSDMRNFSHPGEPTGQPTRVEDIVTNALSLVGGEVKHRARIRRDLAPTPPIVVDRVRLGQAILNILLNASQVIEGYTPDNNWISVATRSEANGVFVEIGNSGPPIPDEVQPKIFDPFFTTKKAGEGVGLGLSIAFETVRRHGGSIEVESNARTPTLFRIWLPLDTGLGIYNPPSVRPSGPTTNVSILIVDDDHLLRRSLRRSLEKYFDVHIAPNALQAFALLESRDFDVILCDLLMPEVTGMEFFDRVRARWPERARRFVFLTGGTNTPEAREFLVGVDNPRAFKPVHPDDLVRLIRECVRSLRPFVLPPIDSPKPLR